MWGFCMPVSRSMWSMIRRTSLRYGSKPKGMSRFMPSLQRSAHEWARSRSVRRSTVSLRIPHAFSMRFPEPQKKGSAGLRSRIRELWRMMKTFELFYEMKHTPFTRGIPTSVLYKTHQSSEVFSRLEYTAKNQLFAVLIGEPGTGKTSTLRRLKDELPESEYMVLYISDSKLTPRSFYNYLLIQLGCKSEFLRNTTRDNLHKQIEIMRTMRSRKEV